MERTQTMENSVGRKAISIYYTNRYFIGIAMTRGHQKLMLTLHLDFIPIMNQRHDKFYMKTNLEGTLNLVKL
jgi:hypothetical protein